MLSKEKFKALFDAHFEEIRRYLYYRSGDEALATDLAQETFLRIWEKQYALEPGKDKALLYKIAGDYFVSHVRKQKKFVDFSQEFRMEIEHQGPDDSLAYEELLQKYERSLGKMPEKQRTVFLMSRMEELSYKEIAERLALSVKAVEKRMSLALKSLRTELNYHG